MRYSEKWAFRAALVAIISGCILSIAPGIAQPPSGGYQDRKKAANESVVTIIGSGSASSYTLLAEDIQNVVDEPDVPGGLRVLPILGRGGGQSALDVLLLKSVDMGIVEADDVNTVRKKEPAVFENFEQRLHYITKLANSEFQVIARKDVKSLLDLEGKRVSCSKKLSSPQIACDTVFKAINVKIQELNLDQEEAGAKLRSGEIDAFVRYAAAPHGAFKGFRSEDGFHMVPIDSDTLGADRYGELLKFYTPALLKSEYYPQLIAPGKPVPTIAGSMLLVVYNWPTSSERYAKLAKFVNKFFDSISKFQGPGRHPKWKEINVAYEVPGWTRFRPAQIWLDAHKDTDASTGGKLRADFDDFLRTQQTAGNVISKEQRDVLFQQFMAWYSNNRK
jgi:TRAP-type uncharacterized transport system substrate-binding protein